MPEDCDVCIVGAGLCGMNALFVAGSYLRPDQKVILIDRRARVGGMWVDTYLYVRLHQPHPMFTAGNIKWTLGREPSYLATKREVLDHFSYCLQQIKQRVRVEERYDWDFQSADVIDGAVHVGRAVKEKRATFALTPGIDAIRPRSAPGPIGLHGAVPNLYLAGDWCDTGWPATMEGAVRSGYEAAGAVTGQDCGIGDLPPGPLARVLGLKPAGRIA